MEDLIASNSREQILSRWPALNYREWRDTCQTLHRWSQILGKIRLSKTPWVNHGWNSTLYVSDRGLTTSLIHDETLSFSLELDLLSHALRASTSNGDSAALRLASEPVAAFYGRCSRLLRQLGIEFHISAAPNELSDALRFNEDYIHKTYAPEYAEAFWRSLLQADRVLKIFRARYSGKASPVHFFWGSMDLAVTRFSGRRAPEHPGGIPHLPDVITREAYSHEVSSCGFWPGNDLFPEAAFYSYAYPKPEGFEQISVPKGAYFHEGLREFILPYEAVRKAPSPESLLLDFFQRTFDAAADLGNWDRESLQPSPYLELIQGRLNKKKAA